MDSLKYILAAVVDGETDLPDIPPIHWGYCVLSELMITSEFMSVIMTPETRRL